MTWKAKVMDLLFPPKCVFCHKLMERGEICPDCEKKLLAMEQPKNRTLSGGTFCVSALPYEDVVRESILRFKFQGRDHYAPIYGEILARTAALELSDRFDLVSWVPVSKKRKRKRGYDQAELLAKEMCRLWGVVPVRTLKKTRDNPPQSGLSSAEERRANVLGVYETANREQFAGKKVLLVDDILTTGSTVQETARVLRLAGAAEVMALTLAAAGEENASASRHEKRT
ncbi:MAG: ComF family protein [Oscillospiraceae bacterium]|nr:ComF family protein [Oscillospiraceae bacterium]